MAGYSERMRIPGRSGYPTGFSLLAHVARSDGRAVLLTALMVVLLGQLVRVAMPLAHALAEDMGGIRGYVAGGVAVFAIFTFAAVAVLRGRPALSPFGAMAVLVCARVAIQLVHPIPIWLGALGLALGLAATPVLVHAVRGLAGDEAVLGGVLVGLAVETAIHGASSTWDLMWRDGIWPLLVTLVLGGVGLAAAAVVPSDGVTAQQRESWPLSLFGPFFALQLLLVQNPAALAAQAGLSLESATAIVVVGDVAAVALASRRPAGSTAVVPLAVAGTLGAAAVTQVSGAWTTLLVVALQCTVVVLLRRALVGGPSMRRGSLPTTYGWFAAGAFTFAVLVLLAQPPSRYRFGIPVAVVLAASVAIVGAGAIARRASPSGRAFEHGLAVAIAALAVPAVFSAAVPVVFPSPDTVGAPHDGPVRVVTYNIHGARDLDGQMDPESTARAIERLRPDVVVLQEVGRGWPIFGTFDAIEWLSHRLGMPYVYEPAADHQLGNSILSRLPIVDVEGGPLPTGEELQQRSYVAATVRAGAGDLLVIGVHLQGGDEGTRARQIERVLAVWDGVAPAVVAGDMNMPADADDVSRFEDAGLVSVQDAIGARCLSTLTDPAEPCQRSDWVFATPDLELGDFVVGTARASDHLPVAVTVTP
ncbi:MAG TPA: endonuclease/exonuclease/phosphatase family protein [Actinomycetota bacterium]|nr:endonuclease/exonuclease/phosphatase family protein [Actinomycetota bacterium]